MSDTIQENKRSSKKIKCVIWDLDNTIWDGILLEDNHVTLRKGIIDTIKVLDERGILQSIASKNNYDAVMFKLEEYGIKDYFLYPQISWDAKSSSVKSIASSINIGIDTVAFIDDQSFELEEVRFSCPEVMCINAENIDTLLDMPEMNPRFITEDSKNRRLMYMNDIKRNVYEEKFNGVNEEFLASLKMVFKISKVNQGDLQRAEELTVRTHQLNTTGYTYSYEELDDLRKSDNHKFWISELNDIFGSYGKIGLALVECSEDIWTVKLLLMSCRVVSRGVGTVMMIHIMNMAREKNVRLRAEFNSNERNRMMYISYKFLGFRETHKEGMRVIFEHDLAEIPKMPEYIQVTLED